ncbi:AAA family ATPase [Tyzzerella sp. OttesenSCG-928-J15]|nr:AAA family ATPase [Tyzzerella sp. OttesenSCG-928-J15]
MDNVKKMRNVMAELNGLFAEREELVEYLAIALLTRNNLFILGKPGQAKSMIIDNFRNRIVGAKQFKIALNKEANEEMLFGRIDLPSLIQGKTTMITDGKIPDSDIVFLDELFKANDGILNSLLAALNEREYTNEGKLMNIPTISFFSASNEIPDFKDKSEQSLLALYDRFPIKIVTENIQDKRNRLKILEQKQNTPNKQPLYYFTLEELRQMQAEVKTVTIPSRINEAMDYILCEIREKGVFVSDRKFLEYSPIVQTKAWLEGRTEVMLSDLLILKNYLWFLPKEIGIIEAVLERNCINPLSNKLAEFETMAAELENDFLQNYTDGSSLSENAKAFNKFRSELTMLFERLMVEKDAIGSSNTVDMGLVNQTVEIIENISKSIHKKAKFTYIPMEQLAVLQQ